MSAIHHMVASGPDYVATKWILPSGSIPMILRQIVDVAVVLEGRSMQGVFPTYGAAESHIRGSNSLTVVTHDLQ
jgi:hypothetical protein